MTEYITGTDEHEGHWFTGEKITRCRDCKHYDTDDAASEVYSDRYWCNKICRYMPSCGYCSWGERK